MLHVPSLSQRQLHPRVAAVAAAGSQPRYVGAPGSDMCSDVGHMYIYIYVNDYVCMHVYIYIMLYIYNVVYIYIIFYNHPDVDINLGCSNDLPIWF